MEEICAQFPFPLSDFQKMAMLAFKTDQDVLICAPTGSGKTLPAEFAITSCVGNQKRVLYLSPIKALSNQKYSEFSKKYPDISFGIVTGDIKRNVLADVLIMTTEILTNKLLAKSLQKEKTMAEEFELDFDTIGAVIFDEIHFINDISRGHAIETALMHIPKPIQLVMLSATLENPQNFVKWLESLPQQRKVCLALTTKREVPLVFKMFLATSENNLRKIKTTLTNTPRSANKNKKEFAAQIDAKVDAVRKIGNQFITIKEQNKSFDENNFQNIRNALNTLQISRISNKRQFILNSLVKQLVQSQMLPAIVFAFSRKDTEIMAGEITEILLDDDDKQPYTIRNECIDILRTNFPTEYKNFTQLAEFEVLVALMSKGIAFHHSTMLPIFKELVEIMVESSRIKSLFATESFAIGLDCPIKTTVFAGLHKFDGNAKRLLYPHEYTQMAGRAGRRGKDTIGFVVNCMDLINNTETSSYRQMLSGIPAKLSSKFEIDKVMVLKSLAFFTESTTVDEIFANFVEASLFNREIKTELAVDEANKVQLTAQIAELESKYNVSFKLCETYSMLQTKYAYSINKTRKEIAAKLKLIEDEFGGNELKLAMCYFTEFQQKKEELQFLTEQIQEKTFFGKDRIADVLITLTKQGLVRIGQEYTYKLNAIGFAASCVTKTSSVSLLLIFQKFEFFKDLSVENIVAFLMAIVSEKQQHAERAENIFDFQPEKEIYEILSVFKDMSEEEFSYDEIMTNSAFYWCHCNDDLECSIFWKKTATLLGFSVGLFVKLMIELSNLSKEFQTALEIWLDHSKKISFEPNIQEQHTLSCSDEIAVLELSAKLQQVDTKILKNIVSVNSLYV
jgi:superfamily II RNA helicase